MVLYKSLKGGGTSSASDTTLGAASASSTATILGLKVVGGKLMPDGRYGAIVEKVKKGSVADTVGRLLPGNFTTFDKEVLKQREPAKACKFRFN